MEILREREGSQRMGLGGDGLIGCGRSRGEQPKGRNEEEDNPAGGGGGGTDSGDKIITALMKQSSTSPWPGFPLSGGRKHTCGSRSHTFLHTGLALVTLMCYVIFTK